MSQAGFQAWQVQPLSQEQFERLGRCGPHPSQAQVHHLLAFSVLAPSAHNSVPQKYRIDSKRGQVDIFVDPQHLLKVSDPESLQAMLSVGCAIENLLIAARHFGLNAKWKASANLPPLGRDAFDNRKLTRLGSVSLRCEDTSGETNDSLLLQAVCERRVIRAEYDNRVRLPDQLQLTLQDAVAQVSPTLRLRIFTETRKLFSWAKLDEMAMKSKLEEAAFRHELGGSLVSDEDRQSPRGMRGTEFGLEPAKAKQLASQLRGDLTLPADQTALMAKAGRVAMASASAVAVITRSGDSASTALDAGRAYQRCALIAWQQGIAHSVHAGAVQVPHVRAMCCATLLSGEDPAMIFRLGKPLNAADWGRPHASRPPVTELLVFEKNVQAVTDSAA